MLLTLKDALWIVFERAKGREREKMAANKLFNFSIREGEHYNGGSRETDLSGSDVWHLPWHVRMKFMPLV